MPIECWGWFQLQVRENKLFTEATWQTYRSDGSLREHKGVHAINDGGYHRWRETMAGQKPDEAGTLALAVAGALSESVRKDSECVFGIKKRWCFVKV